jgi:hypothetical protein
VGGIRKAEEVDRLARVRRMLYLCLRALREVSMNHYAGKREG